MTPVAEYQTFSTDDSSYSENSDEECSSDEDRVTSGEGTAFSTSTTSPNGTFHRMSQPLVPSFSAPVQYADQCYTKQQNGQSFGLDGGTGSHYQSNEDFGFNHTAHFAQQLLPQSPHDASHLMSLTSAVPAQAVGHEDHQYTDLSLSVPQTGCALSFPASGEQESRVGETTTQSPNGAFGQQEQSGCSADSFGEILKESLVDAAV